LKNEKELVKGISLCPKLRFEHKDSRWKDFEEKDWSVSLE
jgi:hypothetical protein